jgi:hypothetical protein
MENLKITPETIGFEIDAQNFVKLGRAKNVETLCCATKGWNGHLSFVPVNSPSFGVEKVGHKNGTS